MTSNNSSVWSDDFIVSTLLNAPLNFKGKPSDGTVINSYYYTYDDAHNQISKTDSNGLTQYAYDALNRLLSVEEPSVEVTSYTYDRAGNRLTQTVIDGSTTTIDESVYNEQNRLTNMTTKIDLYL